MKNYTEKFSGTKEFRDEHGKFHFSAIDNKTGKEVHAVDANPFRAILALAPEQKYDCNINGTSFGRQENANGFSIWRCWNGAGWWVDVKPAHKAGNGTIFLSDCTGFGIYVSHDDRNMLGKWAELYDLQDFDFRIFVVGDRPLADVCREAFHGAMLQLNFNFINPDQVDKFTVD